VRIVFTVKSTWESEDSVYSKKIPGKKRTVFTVKKVPGKVRTVFTVKRYLGKRGQCLQ
jgi:hypothetical protein